MTAGDPTPRVVATEAALEAIGRLQAARGPVMFFMSGGCCDGSLPICLDRDELVTGQNDLLMGQVGGTDFWIAASQDAAWGHPQLVLDVEAGSPEGLSLGTLDERHFVVRSPGSACAPTTSKRSSEPESVDPPGIRHDHYGACEPIILDRVRI
jgi:uncharacterized protein